MRCPAKNIFIVCEAAVEGSFALRNVRPLLRARMENKTGNPSVFNKKEGGARMKNQGIVWSLFVFLLTMVVVAQDGEEQKGAAKQKALLIYEESNKGIDAWRELFREEAAQENIVLEESSAKDVTSKDISAYDIVLIHGAVMAFTFNEPIREWLKKAGDLSGKKVGLIVTASKWFLKKYNDQLLKLMKSNKVNLVDAVSCATSSMQPPEKRNVIREQLKKMR